MSSFLDQPISDFCETKVFFCTSKTTLSECLELLSKHHISSLPVLDEEKMNWIGFVDILDILFLVVTMSEMPSLIKAWTGTDIESEEKNWKEFLSNERAVFKENKVSDLLGLSKERNFWFHIEGNYPMRAVMDLMDRNTKLRRIAIVDPNDKKKLIGVLSQSKILQVIQEQIEKGFSFPQWEKTLTQLEKETGGNWKHDLFTVSVSSTALQGYQLMLDHNVYGVAVVDPDNKLVGSLSANDLKYSEPQNLFSDLYLPLPLYLEKSREIFKRDYHEKSLHPITVSKETTLKEIITKICKNRIHRLFVLDQNGKLENIISLTDIITLLLGKASSK